MFHICFVGTTNKRSSKLYKHVVQHSIESTINTINPKVNYVLATKVEESGTFDANGLQNSWLNIVWKVKAHYGGTFQARKCTFFWVHFVLFCGKFFFHFI
jgi:hypothetical protein